MIMQKIITIVGVLVTAVVLGLPLGCVAYEASVVPPRGVLIEHITVPLTTNMKSTPCGKLVKKYSKSKSYYLHDPFFSGLDFSWHLDGDYIARLAREGGITKIAYADYELFGVLDVYAKFTINIYGD